MTTPHPYPCIGFDRKQPEYYKGLRIKADTGLHDQLAQFIAIAVEPLLKAGKKPRILDWGCGEGAMAQRLHDLGFSVLAVDTDKENFKAKGPEFLRLDFNDHKAVESFAGEHRSSFDIIIALEVIEHVKNPWDFLENIRELCGAATQVFITTPNISSWWGRFMFLITGNLWGFDAQSWQDPGHINPLGQAEMEGLLRETGFSCLGIYPCGTLPVIWIFNIKRILISLFMLPLYMVMKGQKNGWALCYHAKLSGK